MIVRTNISCETCQKKYTLRIGLGHDETQKHTFLCFNCKEEIVVSLRLDLENSGYRVEPGINCNWSQEEGTIINLDPHFVIDEKNISKDGYFPRMEQMRDLMRQKEKLVDELYGEGSFEKLFAKSAIPEVTIHFNDEWSQLKKGWSLYRSGNFELSEKRTKEFSKKYYADDPLSDAMDWLWRFCRKIGGTHYELMFDKITDSFEQLKTKRESFKRFMSYFEKELFQKHQDLHFDIFKQYFSAYDSFSQVHIYCSTGMSMPDGYIATSHDFDEVKMFYGNAFEAFTTVVETLAYMNNILLGREFDAFAKLSFKEYQEIDKSGRCNAFSMNADYFSLCDCVDNQIRNASHHGDFLYNSQTKEINYRAGKGGTGAPQTINYTSYLMLCEKIFLSLTVIARIDLVLSSYS